MDINTFIATYNGQVPAEEIILLRAAAAHYEYYYNQLDQFSRDQLGLKPINIVVISGEGGSTAGGSGEYVITVPNGNNGFNGVPVAGISGWGNATFLIYDSKMALVHELGHIILSLLGISTSNGANIELMLAALASVASSAGIANVSPNSTDAELRSVALNVREIFGLVVDKPFALDTEPTDISGVRADLLARANAPDGSYENIFNKARNFYTLAGIDPANTPAANAYRVGYISHAGQGAADPDQQWKTYGSGESAGAPGKLETLIEAGTGVAWLGNQYNNTLKTGGGADYIDGGKGDDILDGGKGNDILVGGVGNDTYKYTTGDGFDTLLDSDGNGSIVMDGATLAGGAQYGDPRVFRAKGANGVSHLYTYVTGDKTTGGDLIVDGVMLIKDYKPGAGNNMGLTFADAVADTNPVTTNTPPTDRPHR